MKIHGKTALSCGFAICGLVLFGSLGCSKYDNLATVSGRVTVNGQPMEGLQVTFTSLDQEKRRPSKGTCDADGEYTLMFTINEKGGTVGRNRVSIEEPLDDMGEPVHKGFGIPAKYGLEGELEYTVEPGNNTDVDFDLEIAK